MNLKKIGRITFKAIEKLFALLGFIVFVWVFYVIFICNF
jgi:hypothetical protein